jgi:hypothetical protein
MIRALSNPIVRRAVALALIVMLPGCAESPAAAPGTGSTFTVEVSGERFKVRVEDAGDVAALRGRMASGTVGVIIGKLVRGNGGFNTPWSWHLDPKTVEVVDFSIELCDGRPSMVETGLDAWLRDVGSFCPWGAKVIAVSS